MKQSANFPQIEKKSRLLKDSTSAIVKPIGMIYWIALVGTESIHVYQKCDTGFQRVRHGHEYRIKKIFTDATIDALLIQEFSMWLGRAALNGFFCKLALAGPNEMLDILRAHLPKEAERRLCNILEDDLAEIKDCEKEDRLIDIVWF